MKTAGFTEETGQVVADWLAANPTNNSEAVIVVHSFNPTGADLMCSTLTEAGRNCVKHPFDLFRLECTVMMSAFKAIMEKGKALRNQ